MANVLDVAAFILEDRKSLSTMKLQKLVFYSQAYHLVRHGSVLFPDRIEAWANGPVVRALFREHRREFVISCGFFSGKAPGYPLDAQEVETIRHVISKIGSKSGAELSDLTHQEDPWRNARGSLLPSQPSDVEITPESIRQYYGSSSCQNPVFR